jgi:hypothetical protein
MTGVRILLVLALAITRSAFGQQSASFHVVGRVRDSISGRAPTRAQVCAFADSGASRPLPRCGSIDSVGHYRIDSVAPGRRLLTVHCDLGAGPAAQQLAFEHLVISGDVQRNWLVDASTCDARPIRQAYGIFRGHYASGFEMSAFRPCAADSWARASDTLKRTDPVHAWVTWDSGARRVPLPPIAPDSFGVVSHFVRWRGTVEGPGHYGHMGISPFAFRVDSILESRAPGPNDCR